MKRFVPIALVVVAAFFFPAQSPEIAGVTLPVGAAPVCAQEEGLTECIEALESCALCAALGLECVTGDLGACWAAAGACRDCGRDIGDCVN